jgi:hypothetical protein
MSKGNLTRGPRKGRPPLADKDKGKPTTMRLHPHTITARNELAAAWGCDRTRTVEECIALASELALTGTLPPLKHRPALDGPANDKVQRAEPLTHEHYEPPRTKNRQAIGFAETPC